MTVFLFLKRTRLLSACGILALGGLLGGCTRDNCGETDPEQTQPIRFYLVDPQGVPLIKRQNTTYDPDSVKVLYQGAALVVSARYDSGLDSYVFETIDFTTRIKGTDLQLLLRLPQSEPDTLDITYRLIRGDCSTYLEPATYFFNRNRIYPDLSKASLLKLVKEPG